MADAARSAADQHCNSKIGSVVLGVSMTARLTRGGGTRWAILGSLFAVLIPGLLNPGIPTERILALPVIGLAALATAARARADKRHRQSEERAQLILNNTSDILIRYDHTMSLLWASAAITRTLGWVPDELVGVQLPLTAPSARTNTLRQFTALVARGVETIYSRDQMQCADGSARWMDTSLRLVRGADGSLEFAIASLRDAQKAVETELSLASTQEHYRLLAENASDVVVRSDPSGVLQWVSESSTGTLGWRPDELVDRTFRDIVHPDDLPRLVTLRANVERDTMGRIEARVLTAHGTWLWLELSARAVRDDTGALVAIIGGWRDVQATHVAAEALELDRARLQATLQSLLDPHVVLQAIRDQSGTIVDFSYDEANHAACSYMGLGPDELIGARLLELLPGRAGSGMLEMYAHAVESGKPLVRDDFTYGHELLGQGRRYDIRATRIGDGLSFTWRDVTGRHETAMALAASEDHYRLLTEHASDLVFRSNADSLLEWISPSITDHLGWSPIDVIGRPVAFLMHPDDVPNLVSSIQAVKAGAPSSYEARLRSTQGDHRWFAFLAHPIMDAEGVVTHRVGGARDITAEVEAREALARSEARFRTAMDSAPIGMAVLDQQRAIVEANPALCRMLERDLRWLLGRDIAEIIDPQDDQLDQQMRDEAVRGDIGRAAGELRLIAAGGREVWVEQSVSLLQSDDGTFSFVSQFVDITQTRQAKEWLAFLASHDTLTDLANRRELLARMAHHLSFAPTPHSQLAVLFCDLDGLKSVNDRFGHAAGDQVLKEIASRISDVVRLQDIVARLGGDEFVVALPAIRSLHDASTIAAKIHEAVGQPLGVANVVLRPTLSIGIAVATHGDDPDFVLQQADTAVYRAKRQGKNQTVIYDPTIDVMDSGEHSALGNVGNAVHPAGTS